MRIYLQFVCVSCRVDKRCSLDKLLFYGNELSLLIFEVLLFGTMDLAFQNYVFDAAMLYLLMEVCVLLVYFIILAIKTKLKLMPQR